MSLLNDMLKDLSKNKQKIKAVPLIAIQQKKRLRTFPEMSPWVIPLLVCSSLFLMFILLNGLMHSPSRAKEALPALETNFIASVPSTSPKQRLAQITIPQDPLLVSELPVVIFPPIEIQAQQLDREYDLASQAPQINKVYSPMNDEEWYDEQLNLALVAIQNGKDDEAEQKLNGILVRLPKAIDARETLANLYLAQGRIDSASQILDEGLGFSPSDMTLNTIKARLIFEQNHPQQALSILKQFKPDIRKNPDFYGLMAAILHALGKEQEAGNLYKMLVEVEPDNGQYWLGFGLALEQKKENKQAISAYKEVAGHYDTDPDVRAFAESRLQTLQG